MSWRNNLGRHKQAIALQQIHAGGAFDSSGLSLVSRRVRDGDIVLLLPVEL